MVIIGVLFSLFFAAIIAKAAYEHVFRGPWLSQKAANQYLSSYVSQGRRGTIYGANKRGLAVTIDPTPTAVHPGRVEHAKNKPKNLHHPIKNQNPKNKNIIPIFT